MILFLLILLLLLLLVVVVVVVVVLVVVDVFVAFSGVLKAFPFKTFPQCQLSKLASQRVLTIYFKQLQLP
jgi:hypothetical protein